MDKDKTKTRRVLELIVVVTIVGCIALVIVELAGNVRAELSVPHRRGVAGGGPA